MPTTLQLDHIVITVPELERAMADYARLGFTVTRGGEHESFGSHNALIPFEDGSYLELIAFRDERALGSSPAERRVAGWRNKAGFADVALLPQGIAQEVEAARARGVALTEPQAGGRFRPDGQHVGWEFSFPSSTALPFLCADVTPRELRVPPGEARQHPNGATGVLSVTVAVDDLAALLTAYRALLDAPGVPGSVSSLPDTQRVSFSLAASPASTSTTLDVAAPLGPQSPLHDYLRAHGQGAYAVQLRTQRRDGEGPLDLALTQGARLALLYA